MNELKREFEVVKRQCENNPGSRASWIMIAVFLGFCVIGSLVMLSFIL